MKRAQIISIGLSSDYCADDNTELEGVETGSNNAELFTKGLDHVSHWKHSGELGLSDGGTRRTRVSAPVS